MFAPEKYVRWVDLVPELFDWAERILLAYSLEGDGKDPSIAFRSETSPEEIYFSIEFEKRRLSRTEGTADFSDTQSRADSQKDVSERNFCSSIVTYIWICDILLQFDTLVCASDGQTMRAPDLLVLHADRLDWCNLNFPIRKCAEFSYYFDLFDKGVFDGQDLADRFCFIDPLTGTITLKNNSLSSMDMASHLDLNSRDLSRYLDHIVKPYLGHSIVWNSTNFPDEIHDLLDDLGAFEERWRVTEVFDRRSVKKPRMQRRGAKPTGAKDEYFRRYPESKPTNISYEAIAAELAESGFPISARQVQNYERGRRNG
jgi:hypothetical protein